MTFLALYALERVIEKAGDGGIYSEQWLRGETGLKDYETSRACRSLVKSGLVTASQDAHDRRVRLLSPTPRGRHVLARILERAGQRLWEYGPVRWDGFGECER